MMFLELCSWSYNVGFVTFCYCTFRAGKVRKELQIEMDKLLEARSEAGLVH